MTDLEFIKFLWKLLSDDITDGDTPSEEDFSTIARELAKRNIIEDENELFES